MASEGLKTGPNISKKKPEIKPADRTQMAGRGGGVDSLAGKRLEGDAARGAKMSRQTKLHSCPYAISLTMITSDVTKKKKKPF